MCAHEGGTTLRLLRGKWDVVKALTKEEAIEAITQFQEVGAWNNRLRGLAAPWRVWKRESHYSTVKF